MNVPAVLSAYSFGSFSRPSASVFRPVRVRTALPSASLKYGPLSFSVGSSTDLTSVAVTATSSAAAPLCVAFTSTRSANSPPGVQVSAVSSVRARTSATRSVTVAL